jgi:hypothetical protein
VEVENEGQELGGTKGKKRKTVRIRKRMKRKMDRGKVKRKMRKTRKMRAQGQG